MTIQAAEQAGLVVSKIELEAGGAE